MSVGKILIGTGLGFDVLGTLFISIDALQGQQENLKTLNFIAWMFGYKKADIPDETDSIATEALNAHPCGNQQVAALQTKLRETTDILKLLDEAEKIAQARDRRNFQKMIDDLRNGFERRAPSSCSGPGNGN